MGDKEITAKKSVNHAVSGALARVKFQGSMRNIKKYSNVRDTFATIWKEEGPMGYYRGLGARVIYVMPAAAVSFLCYERVSHAIYNPDGYVSAILPLVGIATGSAMRTPFDVVKQRVQVGHINNHAEYNNIVSAAKHIWKYEGFKGLFGTVNATILRDAPFSLMYFSTYELVKNFQLRYFSDSNKQLRFYNYLFAGACAGAVASSVTIPFDVIKTRIQTQATLDNIRYSGVFHAFRTIFKEEGVRGLTAGLYARLIYITPAGAIVFASYEQYKKLFDYFFPNFK